MKKYMIFVLLICKMSVYGQGWFWSYPSYVPPNPPEFTGAGKLYNFYAATDARNISNTGWHIPTLIELDTLRVRLATGSQCGTFLNVAGDKMKYTGTDYWDDPNGNETNSSGWNGKGTGWRDLSGTFTEIRRIAKYLSSTVSPYSSDYCVDGYLIYFSAAFQNCDFTGHHKKEGASIRLICDSSTDPGSYTGNDGKTYSTVKIGNQVWISSNLRETKYRDGTDIPEVTSASAWSALTTGAFCWYNNNSGYE